MNTTSQQPPVVPSTSDPPLETSNTKVDAIVPSAPSNIQRAPSPTASKNSQISTQLQQNSIPNIQQHPQPQQPNHVSPHQITPQQQHMMRQQQMMHPMYYPHYYNYPGYPPGHRYPVHPQHFYDPRAYHWARQQAYAQHQMWAQQHANSGMPPRYMPPGSFQPMQPMHSDTHSPSAVHPNMITTESPIKKDDSKKKVARKRKETLTSTPKKSKKSRSSSKEEEKLVAVEDRMIMSHDTGVSCTSPANITSSPSAVSNLGITEDSGNGSVCPSETMSTSDSFQKNLNLPRLNSFTNNPNTPSSIASSNTPIIKSKLEPQVSPTVEDDINPEAFLNFQENDEFTLGNFDQTFDDPFSL
jgi:hypothetical protein